jgi:hypothetical protein
MEEIFGPGGLIAFSQAMRDDFKYDVAFSFVQKDEQLALQIADRIRDRVRVFVYSEKQEVFVGADGVDQHGRIYEDEARVVVVLYREEWGQTDWTRVEETAIKNRGFKEGYDYLVFVPLDNADKPKWLPKTRIWVGFDRYGINGVASAIEAAVQSEGGSIHHESIADFAVRVGRELTFQSERSSWYESKEGVASAKEEVENLLGVLHQLSEDINNKSPQTQVSFQQAGQDASSLSCKGYDLQYARALGQYASSLEGAKLYVKIIKTFSSSSYWQRKDGLNIVQNVEYEIDMDISRHTGWRELKGEKRFLTSTQLAEAWLKNLLNRILNPKDGGGWGVVEFRI